ncbi:uncharacterized protein B0T15DRAFT_45415 [Chaetomium strumarium]|uniref:Uncharacterized protein n=1 Tax=Chaetomium strumarium TaxID=1170767 RepID=A0AAJ0H2N2_9PEZI|nr:hypothetical protein B0T15DRAFT_45415 [Chaetomium strumarium]
MVWARYKTDANFSCREISYGVLLGDLDLGFVPQLNATKETRNTHLRGWQLLRTRLACHQDTNASHYLPEPQSSIVQLRCPPKKKKIKSQLYHPCSFYPFPIRWPRSILETSDKTHPPPSKLTRPPPYPRPACPNNAMHLIRGGLSDIAPIFTSNLGYSGRPTTASRQKQTNEMKLATTEWDIAIPVLLNKQGHACKTPESWVGYSN